jgi:hypothetical protein
MVEIAYWLAADTDVLLALYDIAGREVRVIDCGVRPAGLNRATLDSSGLSPGIYLVRLSGARAARLRKIVIAG